MRTVHCSLVVLVALLASACSGSEALPTSPSTSAAPFVGDGSARVTSMDASDRVDIGNGNVQCASGQPIMQQTNVNGQGTMVLFEANLPKGWTKATWETRRFRNWPGDDQDDNALWLIARNDTFYNTGDGASQQYPLAAFEQGHQRTRVVAYCGAVPTLGGYSAPMGWSFGNVYPVEPPAPVCTQGFELIDGACFPIYE